MYVHKNKIQFKIIIIKTKAYLIKIYHRYGVYFLRSYCDIPA
jgi:hypothetical protein